MAVQTGASALLLHETVSSISEDSIVDWISGWNYCLKCSEKAPRTRVLKLWAPHTTDDLSLNIVMVSCKFAPEVAPLQRILKDL